MDAIPSLTEPPRPTRVRYGVLGFACALSMITYLDRVCLASAAPFLVAALGLESVADLRLAFTAFAFAYAAFEIPSGWIGDVFGPRNVLIRIVLWWSLFTALTGLTGLSIGGVFVGFGALVAIRFLFGMGEAGAYPNITRALHNWFPLRERGFAQGAVWMSARLMGGLTPLVWLLLVEGFFTKVPKGGAESAVLFLDPANRWRNAFWVFGVSGLIWCIFFARWFRNRPDENPSVNAAELRLIGEGRDEGEAIQASVPWSRLLTSGNLWALCLMYFCGAYGWYFNITYLPTFLEQQHGVPANSVAGAIYKGGPLWMGAIACLCGGWFTDWFIRRTGNRKWGRRSLGILGHGLCAVCYSACLFTPNVFTFFLAISLAAFFNDLTMASAWACCQDIGKRYAAIVAGCMNTVGNLGGAAAGWVTGLVLNHSLESYANVHELDLAKLSLAEKTAGLAFGYQLNFVTFALVYVVAVLLWLRVDATKPVVSDT
jgi:MFS family permease